MNKQTDEALKGIIDAINEIVDDRINNSPFDVTKNALITLARGNNTYDVLLADKTYTIKSNGDTSYVAGNIVKVMIPQNNYNLMFIMASGSGGGTSTTNYADLTNKPQINSITLNAGNNVIDAGDIGAEPELIDVIAKTTMVDADHVIILDSQATNVTKKITWANIKVVLKTYFDGIYNNYVHPNHSGDVTSVGDGATTISADAVTNSKLSNMVANTIKGRATASTGDPEDLSATQVRTILNVADGANNYSHPTQTAITSDNSNGVVLQDISVNTLGHVISVGTVDLDNRFAKTATYTETLTSGGWTGASAPYSQTITVTGMTSTDNAIVDASLTGTYTTDQAILSNFALVYRMVSGTNQVTAYATSIPAVNLPLQFKVVR